MVLSLILAALFGLIYLLMIPQYVDTHIHAQNVQSFYAKKFVGQLERELFFTALSENWESPDHSLVSFSLRGMLVLLLLVLCVCFHVACVMYLHLTSVQVRFPDLSQQPHVCKDHTLNTLFVIGFSHSVVVLGLLMAILCLFVV